MLLTTGDYLIRDFTQDDLGSIARHADNPLIAGVLRDLFPTPYSEADAREYIGRIKEQDPRTTFAIATKEEAFGCIGYVPGKDVYSRTAEIGYWIGKHYWGQGIMTGVVKVFSNYLFETYEFNRLFAGIFSSNPASGRVLEKAGFVNEGILKARVYKNGQILDEHMYARVRPGLIDG